MTSNNILSYFLILFMILGVSSCKDDTPTISECIKCNEYEVGDTFSLDGVTYTVADREMLDKALLDGKDLTKYCTSKVTDMDGMFERTPFNQDIGNWDVSKVTDMNYMFFGANAFNQNIGNWDVSKVTDMNYMFFGANAFNQNIGNWDVSSVIGT
jgi:surface protein